jgi:hypothetical protein
MAPSGIFMVGMHYHGYCHAVTLAPHSPLVVSLQYRPGVGETGHIHDLTDDPLIVPVRRELSFPGPACPVAVPATPAIPVEDVRGRVQAATVASLAAPPPWRRDSSAACSRGREAFRRRSTTARSA